ncbi:hypothetical protein [Ochrobactrum sp. BTU1]|uniref:hypothetical protein n=1 Tax=Ochrobactrum sp. BTU1 TaxID=2840456 RepID=UPI001C04B47E|nr:hypothetical protein KMS41_18910 [Ochrobactrum sp. BTU1]
MLKISKSTLTCILVGISLLCSTIGAAAQEGLSKSELVSFFKSAVYTQTVKGRELVLRWTSNRIMCVAGSATASDFDKVSLFTYAINRITNLNVRTFFRKTVQDCPNDSLIYLNFRSKADDSHQSLQDKLDFVDRIQGYSATALSSPNPLAFMKFKIGGQGTDYIFIDLPSLGPEMDMFAGNLRNELIEKSVFQMLTGVSNTEHLQKYPTSLKSPLTTLPPELSGDFVLKHKRQSPNLCLLDVMFLYSLYRPKQKENIVPMEMDYHLDYIRNKFNEIEKISREVYFRPDFNDIFPRKC